MKIKKKIMILGMCLFLTTGCGSKIPTLKNGEEAVVSFEDGSMISVDDLYENVKTNYALNALVNMIDKKILESEYKDLIKDAETYTESTMKSLEENYGDDLAQMIQYYTGYQTVDAYKDYVYLNYLQNEATEDYAKNEITDKQINNYYKDSVYGDVEVSHILIVPETTDTMTDDEKKAAEAKAEEKAKNIIAELKQAKDVKAKFSELATANSQDDATKANGGSLGYINYGSVGTEYDNIIAAALKLKNNAYSTSVVKTTLGYHVILRTNQKEKASLEDVKDTIIETLSNELITNDTTTAVKAMQALRKKYGVDIQDTELKTQYANYIQNSLTANEEK